MVPTFLWFLIVRRCGTEFERALIAHPADAILLPGNLPRQVCRQRSPAAVSHRNYSESQRPALFPCQRLEIPQQVAEPVSAQEAERPDSCFGVFGL